VVTFYYVEHVSEWEQVTSGCGSREHLLGARESGTVRLIGLTTHQRDLAARTADSGLLDLLMIRYNAAHRSAGTEVFPATRRGCLPVVAFTCLRWGTLLKATPDDPPGFTPPPAREWYRYVLAHPDVSVALMAPNGRDELNSNLRLLNDWRPLTDRRADEMSAHGDRVHHVAGQFL